MLDRLGEDDFRPYLNGTFRIHAGDAELMECRLVDIQSIGPPAARPERRSPFSLVFRSSTDTYIPQGIRRLEHDRMGTLDIFLVPIGPDGEGMLYEAVFN